MKILYYKWDKYDSKFKSYIINNKKIVYVHTHTKKIMCVCVWKVSYHFNSHNNSILSNQTSFLKYSIRNHDGGANMSFLKWNWYLRHNICEIKISCIWWILIHITSDIKDCKANAEIISRSGITFAKCGRRAYIESIKYSLTKKNNAKIQIHN